LKAVNGSGGCAEQKFLWIGVPAAQPQISPVGREDSIRPVTHIHQFVLSTHIVDLSSQLTSQSILLDQYNLNDPHRARSSALSSPGTRLGGPDLETFYLFLHLRGPLAIPQSLPPKCRAD
jgi:hypothetical protein